MVSTNFKTAEELMDHLKKQIIQFSNDLTIDEEFFENSFNSSDKKDGVDLSRVMYEREGNNLLWNVSAEMPITSHRKNIIGKIIVFGKKVLRKLLRWYVSKTFESQSTFNGSVTRSINELTNVLASINEINKGLERTLKAQGVSLEQLQIMLEEQKLNTEIGIDQQQVMISQLEIEKDDMVAENNKMAVELAILLKRTINYKNIESISMEYPNSKEISEKNMENTLQFSTESKFDYLSFENKFRGSLAEIKNRQTVYVPYFFNQENVLDIGCGRGEFIELLQENNITISGIDLNDEMVEFCQAKGLPVSKQDAIQYLVQAQDNSLGGLFLGQVIEHMHFEQIVNLVELAFQKLKKGSYLIMETPNPLTLAILYRTFYVDPTHVKPIHPLTIQYVVEMAGFTEIELKYSSRVEENWFIPQLSLETDKPNNLIQFNQSLNYVNDLLYGNLDYAIIARK
jgi:2-polyprenyl-3-methyl-5-hydroxy-6-metoxy-1,4-benzoquinol methylase